MCMQAISVAGHAVDPASSVPQHFIFAKMEALAAALPCRAALRRLRDLVSFVAGCAHANFEEWGDFDWHESGHAMLQAQCKRRRVDFHVRQVVVAGAMQPKSASTRGQAARSISGSVASCDIKWRATEMVAYRASTRMTFKETHSVSLTVDALRLVRPGREVMVGSGYDFEHGLHAVLPPQVGLTRVCVGGGRR